MKELNQALDNVSFLKKLLDSNTYSLTDAPKAVSAARFLEAILTGIEAKKGESDVK